jgi:cytochrome c
VKREFMVLIAIACLGTGPAKAQDSNAGQTVFKRCSACHDIGDAAKNRMGPVLTGVVGRVAGTYKDFKYSQTMVAAGAEGLVWTPARLDQFLISPNDFVKGTKMNFRVQDANDRANVIVYLQTFSTGATARGGQ